MIMFTVMIVGLVDSLNNVLKAYCVLCFHGNQCVALRGSDIARLDLRVIINDGIVTGAYRSLVMDTFEEKGLQNCYLSINIWTQYNRGRPILTSIS